MFQQKLAVIEGTAPPVVPPQFGRDFPDRWRAYLRAHYRDAVQVAYAFGISATAAQKWWDGSGGPNGHKVAWVFIADPEGAARYLGEAA